MAALHERSLTLIRTNITFYPPNIEALRALSDETKGKFQPEAADIFATQRRNGAVSRCSYGLILSFLPWSSMCATCSCGACDLFEHQ